MALTKGADLAIGGDLLAGIQDVPPVVQDEPTVAAKREELQTDLSSGGSRPRPSSAPPLQPSPSTGLPFF